MNGWAHQVDGDLEDASATLRRALDLDPANDEAAEMLADTSQAP
ncbi:MAG: tetratricopeptide repeat protein [Nocardioides sp.]